MLAGCGTGWHMSTAQVSAGSLRPHAGRCGQLAYILSWPVQCSTCRATKDAHLELLSLGLPFDLGLSCGLTPRSPSSLFCFGAAGFEAVIYAFILVGFLLAYPYALMNCTLFVSNRFALELMWCIQVHLFDCDFYFGKFLLSTCTGLTLLLQSIRFW